MKMFILTLFIFNAACATSDPEPNLLQDELRICKRALQRSQTELMLCQATPKPKPKHAKRVKRR